MHSQVHNLIISSIKRNEKTGIASANTKTETDVDSLSETVIHKLTTLFKGSGIRVGDFQEHEEKPRSFEKRLINFTTLDENSNEVEIDKFEEFGDSVSKLLAKKLNTGQAKIAKDGYLITYLYSETRDDEDEDEDDIDELAYYLCLIFLHRISGTDINEEQLILEEIERVNLDSLNLGAKISLNQWYDDDVRVLCFKLGRETGDVRKYFTDFLGCSETTDHIQDTESLKLVIQAVCKALEFDENKANDLLESAKSYCLDRINTYSDQVISLEAVAKSMFPKEEEQESVDLFLDKAINKFKLSEQLKLDAKTLRTFSRLQGQTSDYRVSFNRKALNQSVIFNKKDGSLTLKNLPDELIEELNKI